MSKNIYDIVIIGGGIIGSSTAYHLIKSDNNLRIAVIEPDPTYSKASTTLSMANIRIQFSLKENIKISKYAFEILEKFAEEMAVNDFIPEVTFRREGNLFIISDEFREYAEKAVILQKELDCNVGWFNKNQIKKNYPIYDLTGYAGGTFGPDDGYIDAYSMLMGYIKKAKSYGVEYIEDRVIEIDITDGCVCGVNLASGKYIHTEAAVNCAGAWAADVADMVGVNLPVKPVKRQVFTVDTEYKPENPLPLTVLPSGLYFRSETGGLLLVGKSMQEDSVGFDFAWDNRRFFDQLWPELVGLVPLFDKLKLIRGWAGLYAVNTFDSNAILGECPQVKGFFLANGFSGHGLQQAPAVGRYITELITGNDISLDLSIFKLDRILNNKPIIEDALV